MASCKYSRNAFIDMFGKEPDAGVGKTRKGWTKPLKKISTAMEKLQTAFKSPDGKTCQDLKRDFVDDVQIQDGESLLKIKIRNTTKSVLKGQTQPTRLMNGNQTPDLAKVSRSTRSPNYGRSENLLSFLKENSSLDAVFLTTPYKKRYNTESVAFTPNLPLDADIDDIDAEILRSQAALISRMARQQHLLIREKHLKEKIAILKQSTQRQDSVLHRLKDDGNLSSVSCHDDVTSVHNNESLKGSQARSMRRQKSHTTPALARSTRDSSSRESLPSNLEENDSINDTQFESSPTKDVAVFL